MPTYQYRCPTCGDYEVTQRITEAALTNCQTCNSPVERLLYPSNFVLKGSGWYTTDYARKSSSNGESKSASSDSSSETKSETGGGGCGGGACGSHVH